MKFVFGFKSFPKLFLLIISLISFSLVGQISIEDSTDYFAKGLKAHEAGDYEKALKFYNEQLHYFPNDYRTYNRSEEHTSELQSRPHLVCRLLLEKKKKKKNKKKKTNKKKTIKTN